MKRLRWSAAAAVNMLALAGCVPAVMTPTVVVTPGFGKSPADFAADNTACATLADQQLGAAKNTANNQIFGAALLGAAFGGGGTAASGGSNGDVAANAAGNALANGAATAQTAQAMLQRQDDYNYSECMVAKGNVVPGFASTQVVAEPSEPIAATRHVRHARKKPTEKPTATASTAPASAPAAQAANFVEPTPASASGGFAVPPPASH
jgi:hypothetical protein